MKGRSFSPPLINGAPFAGRHAESRSNPGMALRYRPAVQAHIARSIWPFASVYRIRPIIGKVDCRQ